MGTGTEEKLISSWFLQEKCTGQKQSISRHFNFIHVNWNLGLPHLMRFKKLHFHWFYSWLVRLCSTLSRDQTDRKMFPCKNVMSKVRMHAWLFSLSRSRSRGQKDKTKSSCNFLETLLCDVCKLPNKAALWLSVKHGIEWWNGMMEWNDEWNGMGMINGMERWNVMINEMEWLMEKNDGMKWQNEMEWLIGMIEWNDWIEWWSQGFAAVTRSHWTEDYIHKCSLRTLPKPSCTEVSS